jgi:hypothetical protein
MKDAPAIVVITRKYYPFSNIALGLGLYFVGILVSIAYGVILYFVQMWLFTFAVLGIMWVTSMWVWAFKTMPKIMDELFSNFQVSEHDFNKLKQSFIKSISDDKLNFVVSIPGFAFATYHIWLLFSGQISLPIQTPQTLVGNYVFGAYVLILFFICVYLICASAHLLLRAILFISELTKFPIRINLLQFKNKVSLNQTNNAIVIGSCSWFVGVSFVMTIVFVYSSTIIVAFLVSVVAVGLLFFFIPQVFLHKAIRSSKEILLSEITAEFSKRVSLPLSPKCDTNEALLLYLLLDYVNKIKEWPFDIGNLFNVLASSIIPIMTTIIGIVIK